MRTPLIDPSGQPRPSKRRPAASAAKRAVKKQRAPKLPKRGAVPQDDTTPQIEPFGATESALSDMEAADERAADSVETLPELEREFGIADWIDPQTGEPAQGQSPPHLEEE